jgi:hypothetical protein
VRAITITMTLIFMFMAISIIQSTAVTNSAGQKIFPIQSTTPTGFLLFSNSEIQPGAMNGGNGTMSNYIKAPDQPALSNLYQYMGYFTYGIKLAQFLVDSILSTTVWLPKFLNSFYLQDGWCNNNAAATGTMSPLVNDYTCYIVPWNIAWLIAIAVNILNLFALLQIVGIKDLRGGA